MSFFVAVLKIKVIALVDRVHLSVNPRGCSQKQAALLLYSEQLKVATGNTIIASDVTGSPHLTTIIGTRISNAKQCGRKVSCPVTVPIAVVK